MASPKVWAVVMAGGSGTRFWPASRSHRPKQLLPLGGGHESLLAATVGRIAPLVPTDRILVVTAAGLAEATRQELPSLPTENLLAEPSPRNTAPCIGWATRVILDRDPDAIVAVLPSDQHVADPAGLRASISSAIELAKVRSLATIGIRPTRPDTGFGYIETGGFVPDVDGAHEVSRFVEKPDVARAREYLASGRFLWNSGMFFFRASFMDAAIREHLPELSSGLDKMFTTSTVGQTFPTLPSISIDYGVVERVGATPGQVGVVPGDFGWSDVGSWESAWELAVKDEQGNALPEGAIAVDAHNNLVRLADEGPSRKQLALVGVNDLCVVETSDAILVLPRSRAQDVRAVVEALKARGRTDLL